MSVYRLSVETLDEARKKDGQKGHKFIATPTKIFFGNQGEAHTLANFWRIQSQEDPELFAHERQRFVDLRLNPCGSHGEAEELAIVDAGFVAVEGLEVAKRYRLVGRAVNMVWEIGSVHGS